MNWCYGYGIEQINLRNDDLGNKWHILLRIPQLLAGPPDDLKNNLILKNRHAYYIPYREFSKTWIWAYVY